MIVSPTWRSAILPHIERANDRVRGFRVHHACRTNADVKGQILYFDIRESMLKYKT
jgi:hypothetical protein